MEKKTFHRRDSAHAQRPLGPRSKPSNYQDFNSEQADLQSELVINSAEMRPLVGKARRAAMFDSTVLIIGETGTGKTSIARMIHSRSARSEQPLAIINCASLPRDLMESELFGHVRGCFTGATTDRKGRIETANGGTVLLDEIGDLPLPLQPKLLTLLQDGTFQRIGSDRLHQSNVRIIGATRRNLVDACSRGDFRFDLYYRLNVIGLEVPPLRTRRREIPKLAEHIIGRLATQHEIGTAQLTESAIDRPSDGFFDPGGVAERHRNL
ncbi:MAG: hypothetical protein CMJ78_06520 [Planctomycetaceae bacterium]|nr:hypothetical protein [Planctomycetaceae bacterium]